MMNVIETIALPVSAIVVREDLYPRISKIPTLAQKYAEDLSVLPPIEVNQRHGLIDGWHRWTAHKKENAETIRAFITETQSDIELMKFAAQRNSRDGQQLSQEDKKRFAMRIYGMAPESERDVTKTELVTLLSVSIHTIRKWTARIDKDSKKTRNRRIFDMWLACHTQEDIAETVGCTKQTVSNVLSLSGLSNFGNLAEFGQTAVSSDDEADAADDADEEAGNHDGKIRLTKTQIQAATHERDFEIPLYNVWKQQTKTPGSGHFGNSEVRWVDNLLYLYTKPFDVVVDPFGGSGSTIDLCKTRLRRYWVGDRKPVVERDGAIRTHDLTEGLPRLSWQDVKLVYLDPPYWAQAAGQYSEDPTDLANMSLDEFTKTLTGIITGFAKKMQPGAMIALLMQPTQWRAPDHQYTDHVIDMTRAVKLPIHMRVQCPYESQQCTPQMVDWAKANRNILVLSRELVVWRVA